MGWARWFGIGALGVAGLGLGGCFVRAPVPEPFPGVAWERTFGGSRYDGGESVQQTTDGGFIIAGYTRSFGAGEADVYLVKTDAQGNLVWQKTFGGSAPDVGQSVQQTTDGGYIVAGWTASFGLGGSAVYLVKTDASGNLEWERTFGGSDWEEARSVQQTTDGGYILAGSKLTSVGGGPGGPWWTNWDVYLVKTDAHGNLEWERTFGGSMPDTAWCVQQTSDGGYIVSGGTESFGAGGRDVYLVKTDALGNLVWQKTFGGSGVEYGSSVRQTTDGGYIIAGDTDSFGAGGRDVYLVKTDALGNLVWQKTFGGSGREDAYSVQQTTDGGYIIAGHTTSFGAGWADVYLVKTDAQGNLVWQAAVGGSDWDDGFSVQQTSDGGYVVVGEVWYPSGDCDVYLIKIHGGAIYWRKAGPTLVEP